MELKIENEIRLISYHNLIKFDQSSFSSKIKKICEHNDSISFSIVYRSENFNGNWTKTCIFPETRRRLALKVSKNKFCLENKFVKETSIRTTGYCPM